MAEVYRKNGSLEIKFNEDRTQVIVNVYPASAGGESITTSEILDRLKSMGVTYGIREQAIRDAIHAADDSNQAVTGIIVAQGGIPKDGEDAKIKYNISHGVLLKPLPKRTDSSGHTEWFALDPAKMVKADDELASILPAQPGTPGKTLTWPIQAITPKPGKPSALNAGQNVRMSDDGLHIYAAQDGYVCLHGEQIIVHALRVFPGSITGQALNSATGLVVRGNIENCQVNLGGFLAVKGSVNGCKIRCMGDIYLNDAVECDIACDGNVIVYGKLINCTINTCKKLLGFDSSVIVGGQISASEGVETAILGADDFTATNVVVGINNMIQLKGKEIEEEMNACEMNITRISSALKPFTTLSGQEAITEDKRQLVTKLQSQKRSQDTRIKELHNEKRGLAIAAKEHIVSHVTVAKTVYPGVMITIRNGAAQIETTMEMVKFIEGPGGKSVDMEMLRKAA